VALAALLVNVSAESSLALPGHEQAGQAGQAGRCAERDGSAGQEAPRQAQARLPAAVAARGS